MTDIVTIQPVLTDVSFCEDGLPLLTANAQLPQVSGHSRFNRYYAACATAFERWCRHEIFPQAQLLYQQALTNAAPLPQWHAALQTVITFQKDSLLSLYADITLTGTPQRTLLRRADTWDLRHSLPVTIADLFPPHTPWRSMLLREAAQQIGQQEAQGVALYDPQWRQKLRRYFHPQQFYLTSDGLCFFFPLCTIAPAAEGLPSFSLPYNRETGPFLPK